MYIQKFRKNFKIDQKLDLTRVSVAIESIYSAYEIVAAYLEAWEPTDDSSGFRVRALLNLLGRTFEHTQAMLVAMATGSPASAEALGRIVVEASVNITYLTAVGNSSTLIEFLRSWLNEHDRKLTDWKKRIEGQRNEAATTWMIAQRREFLTQLQSFVDDIEAQCHISKSSKDAEWPKTLFKRFEAIGRETDYYESYHRLSGASHLTGEDTIIWLLARQMPEGDLPRRMAKEAWAYSIMMTRIASIFFVDAAAACAIAHDRTSNVDLLECKRNLAKAVHAIARDAGVPFPDTV